MASIFDLDSDKVTTTHQLDQESAYFQSQTEAALEAKLVGRNVHGMGDNELREFIVMMSQRLLQSLDADHNVQATETQAVLSALDVQEIHERLEARNIHSFGIDDLILLIMLVDSGLDTPFIVPGTHVVTAAP